jgi:hypothetical protein
VTSASLTNHTISPQPATANDGAPRLHMKPESSATTGFVDGGWWPRSRDLSAEVPALLAALSSRLGRVERVSYHLQDWDPAARKIAVDGAIVRLGGFRSQRADTVDVIAATGRVTLLVVPPDATPGTADRALTTAGNRGNSDSVPELLTSADNA